ncbi:MAG: hypothetical protein OXB95_03155 [Rhodobacteraceae bacterium]|nr:hypothetical protein [Paracoccaceae bacterium]
MVHPSRFLTLWTAYGGMPGHWERFATHDDWRSLREFAAWDDDGEWRANFIETEQRYLDHNPEDRYDNRAFVELAEAHREALLHLANGPGRGCALKEFPNVLRRKADPTLKESLKILAKHLELVEENHDFHGHNSRWRMADNNTRFQISVLRKRQAGTTRLRRKKVGSKVVKRLETHEGPALERLTAGWLDARPEEVDLAEHGVWLPDGKLADIDALAIVGLEEDWTLVLASCKRSAANHEPVRQRRQFEEFMAATGDSEEVLEIRRMPRRLLLVSPSFPADKRAECGDHGFECFGIRDMARAINLDLDRKAQSEDRHLRTRAHSGFGGDRDRS